MNCMTENKYAYSAIGNDTWTWSTAEKRPAYM